MDEDILNRLDKEALILHGLDDCVIGHDDNGILIYSYSKMFDHFFEHFGIQNWWKTYADSPPEKLPPFWRQNSDIFALCEKADGQQTL